jgi:hypothetical protein
VGIDVSGGGRKMFCLLINFCTMEKKDLEIMYFHMQRNSNFRSCSNAEAKAYQEYLERTPGTRDVFSSFVLLSSVYLKLWHM